MLLQALDKLQREWEGAELGVLDYRDTGTCVLKVGCYPFSGCSVAYTAAMYQYSIRALMPDQHCLPGQIQPFDHLIMSIVSLSTQARSA